MVNWFTTSLKWLGLWALPPFLFLIGIGLISQMAYDSENIFGFWIWTIIAYLFLAICLAGYWAIHKKIVKENEQVIN